MYIYNYIIYNYIYYNNYIYNYIYILYIYRYYIYILYIIYIYPDTVAYSRQRAIKPLYAVPTSLYAVDPWWATQKPWYWSASLSECLPLSSFIQVACYTCSHFCISTHFGKLRNSLLKTNLSTAFWIQFIPPCSTKAGGAVGEISSFPNSSLVTVKRQAHA